MLRQFEDFDPLLNVAPVGLPVEGQPAPELILLSPPLVGLLPPEFLGNLAVQLVDVDLV